MSGTSMQTDTFTADDQHDRGDPTGYMPTQSERVTEQSVLGAMLIPATATHRDGTAEQLNSPAIGDVALELQPQHMWHPAHTAIFTAILDIAGRGDSVDAITTTAELERRGELARLGDPTYLHTLIRLTPTASNATYYAHEVRQAADRRAAIDYATRIHQAAAARDGEQLDVVMDQAWRVYEAAVAGAEADALGSVTDDADTLTAVLDQWAGSRRLRSPLACPMWTRYSTSTAAGSWSSGLAPVSASPPWLGGSRGTTPLTEAKPLPCSTWK